MTSTIFVQKTTCQNYFFQILFQTKCSDCESQQFRFGFDVKNPCRFMIYFWIYPQKIKKSKIHFGKPDSEIRIWISLQKTHPRVRYAAVTLKCPSPISSPRTSCGVCFCSSRTNPTGRLRGGYLSSSVI